MSWFSVKNPIFSVPIHLGHQNYVLFKYVSQGTFKRKESSDYHVTDQRYLSQIRPKNKQARNITL